MMSRIPPHPARRLGPAGLGLALLLSGCGDVGGGSAPGPGGQDDGSLATLPGEGSQNLRRGLASKYRKLEAEADNWGAEILNSLVEERLAAIAALLTGTESTPAGLAAIASDSFACGDLRPGDLATLFDDPSVSVVGAEPSAGTDSRKHVGPAGLGDALRALRAPFDAEEHVSAKFKVVHVRRSPTGGTTELLYQAHGPADGGELQQYATWMCTWTGTPEQEDVLLETVEVVRHEESRTPSGTMYADCTAAVLGANPAFEAQLLPHLETWLGSIPARVFGEFLGHQGLAIGDVNGDGLDDVYLCQPGGLPNRLFIQNRDGTASDASAAAGLDILDGSRGALLIDLDGDRDQDLALAASGGIVFFSNEGGSPPRFERRWSREVPQIHSLSAADHDEDGDLDVYCCVYKIPEHQNTTPVPYHDANNGEPNLFLRNDVGADGWTFTDITRETGLDENNRRFSFASSWEDYDNDGDLDLYVANDFGRNNLYRNEAGRFVDVADEAGVEDVSAGMAVSWADFDNDGLMDIYVSNMFSSAGNRIAYQRRFQSGATDATRSLFQRHARGNSLFRNAGDGTFVDVSVSSGVTMGRWAWGSKFVDINNDGLQDLIVPNGLVTSDEPRDL